MLRNSDEMSQNEGEMQSIPKNSPRAKEEEKSNVPNVLTLEQTWSEAFTVDFGPLWSHAHAVESVTAFIEKNPDHQWTGSWWSENGTSFVELKKVLLITVNF